MSTRPYSIDLRAKVIGYIKRGGSQLSAAKVFNISISTVNRWYIRYREEGDYRARKRLGAKIKIDINGLKEEVIRYPDKNISELAEKFKVSRWSIHHWLKRLGFSYKKKPLAIWKQTKKSEKVILKK
jgi:transposase